jgi:hypothetical protein
VATLSEPRRKETIEIDRDIEFQRRSWQVQRIAWVLMLVIVVAAVLGAFGNGPLSSAHAGDASRLSVDYERFVRFVSPEKVTFHIARAAIQPGSSVELWVDREWLARHDVKAIVPEPSETRVTPDRLIYRFSVDSAGFPFRIELDLETMAVGALHGKAGLTDGSTVLFNQFAYP